MKTENIVLIDEAITEAKRFIKKAELAKQRLIDDSKQQWQSSGSKETGALKRSAIDLGRMCTTVNQMKQW